MSARSCRALCLPWAVAAALTHAPAWGADTRLGLQTDFGYDSNVNRAISDKRADSYGELESYAARSFLTGPRAGLVLRAALRAREYFTYSDLSNLGLSARTAWRFQPGSGFTSPWLEAAFQGEALRFRDSPIRDGAIVSASLSAGKWFSDRLRGVASAAYDRRFASEGDVYDLSIPKVWASLDWRLNDSLTLYGTGTLMGGQQVFTARSVRAPGLGWSAASLGTSYAASAKDPVFNGSDERFTAYRADARTTVLEVGVNWALGGNHALDLGLARFQGKADGGPSYDGYTARAGWLYRFR
ncbi:MAG: hypothetical protein ING70_06890 [Rhodocyclaceae bacterium]|nr:hypothetical protein [Rhodocyclaceae bacterium]MCA3145369.1 hypothetical protein [Rhodocyclaceae bacterium]